VYLSRPSLSERSAAATLTASLATALLGAVVAVSRLGDPASSAESTIRMFDVVGVARAHAASMSKPKAADHGRPPAPVQAVATPMPDVPTATAEASAPSPPLPPSPMIAEATEGAAPSSSGSGPTGAAAPPEAAPRAPGTSATPSQSAAEADSYGRLVFHAIHARQNFPSELARAGMEGTVVVELRVSPRGRIIAAAVFLSSRIRQLDMLAIAQVLATPLPAPPRAEARTFRIPMRYQAD